MQLLEAALEQASAAREAFIAERLDLPETVRKRALALLESDASFSQRLQTGGAALFLAEAEEPEQIGSYRVVRCLGKGGMGAVYLGERLTGDFDHQAAIKVIKAGLFSETLIERFRRERQTLAQLNHPHIARLYDGGEMADGAPFLVMEYVPGQTLSQWLQSGRGDRATSIRLFLQICDAVEFAHQNLVIHRDLTPSNILVTDNTEAKLIDFGIARPQVAQGDGATGSTFSGLSLTPGFAAPERFAGAEVNTRADIFSLGKVFEVLLGENKPPELAAIANRAQASNPEDRFATASAVKQAIIDWQERRPVDAYSTSTWYRLRKFVDRERLIFGASAAIAVALVAGLGATGWAYARAEQERREADRNFAQVRALAGFQLFELYDRLDNVVGNIEARMALAAQAQRYLAILAASAGANDDLKLEAARGYIKLALIQGIPARPNLGDHDLASANLEAAEGLLDDVTDLPLAATVPYRSQVHAYRAILMTHAQRKPAQARSEIDRCLALLETVPPTARDETYMLSRSECRLAELEWLDVESVPADLEISANRMLADIKEWPAALQRSPRAEFDRALALGFHATVGYLASDRASQERGLKQNLEADAVFASLERRFPNDPVYLYRRSYNAFYGHVAASQLERDDIAEDLIDQAISTADRLLRLDPKDESLTTFRERLSEAQASFFGATGRFDEAIAIQQSLILGRAAKVGPDRSSSALSDLGFGHAVLGMIARQAGRRELACRSWSTAESLLAEVAARKELVGHVAALRGGMQRNLERCARGEPVSSFGHLRE